MENIFCTCLRRTFRRSVTNGDGERIGVLIFHKGQPTEICNENELRAIADDIGQALVICDQSGKPCQKETHEFCLHIASLKYNQAEAAAEKGIGPDLTPSQKRAIETAGAEIPELDDDGPTAVDAEETEQTENDPGLAAEIEQEESEAAELDAEQEETFREIELAEIEGISDLVRILAEHELTTVGDVLDYCEPEGSTLTTFRGIGEASEKRILDCLLAEREGTEAE